MSQEEGMMVDPICMLCARTIGWPGMECDAYPEGIPQEILNGEVDHTKPYKDDDGLTFVPIRITEE